MEKQTKPNLLVSLQSLGIVFVMLFAMAFACDNGNGGDTPQRGVKTTSGERCSTEAEFKAIITKNYSETFNERDGKFKETEVVFHSFEIRDAVRYTNAYPIIDAEPAYPVKTNLTRRDYLSGSSFPHILEYEIEGRYMFYIDHHDDCVFASDGTRSSQGKSIPYNK